MMRLLVVGASGLVGAELCRRAGPAAVGAARHIEGAATLELDLADRASIDATLERVCPDTIAICSAWPHVDGCELDPDRSRRENVVTVRNLVNATEGADVRLLFFSTDHVFDGSKPGPCVEGDPVRPLSVYAAHKREVEELLLVRGCSLVCRTAWVFGAEVRGKNFVYQVIRHARDGEVLTVPARQSGCPTWSGWLCESVLGMLRQGTEGIVHVSGAQEFTKATWARRIAEVLELPSLEIVETDCQTSGQLAPRPERVAMASSRHPLVQPDVEGILRALRL